MFDWNTMAISLAGISGNVLMTGAEMRDEATAWVSLICTLIITCVTCIVQVIRTMRDIGKDKDEKPFEMPEGSYEDDYCTGEKKNDEEGTEETKEHDGEV